MKDIGIRYGARLPLSVTVDDDNALTAELYVGKAGESPVITQTANFVDGVADLTVAGEDTEVPLGDYLYQINVTYATGGPDKFPDPATCDGELPAFVVYEALDETEVS